MEIAHSPSRMFSCEVRFGQGKLGYLLYCFKGQFLKKLTLLESFKVVPLFSYQGSLCCLRSEATLISYHVFSGLSTTFLFIFFFFTAYLSSEINITIRFSFCQQLFWFFYTFFHLFSVPISSFSVILLYCYITYGTQKAAGILNRIPAAVFTNPECRFLSFDS